MLPNNFPVHKKEFGGFLLYILIGIILFGMLAYTFSRSTNSGSTSIASKGVGAASTADLNEYSRMINFAIDKLQTKGCSQNQISYETPSGININANAPSDKHCHVFNIAGGNVPYRDTYLAGTGGCGKTQLDALTAGQTCGSVVYVGTSGGNRIYTTVADMGKYAWSNDRTVTTGATSLSDGLSNTNKLLTLNNGFTYPTSTICRSLGTGWYLPSYNELALFYTNRNTGALAGTFNTTTSGWYWTSNEQSVDCAYQKQFSDGAVTCYTFRNSAGFGNTRCALRVN